jgi:integrase
MVNPTELWTAEQLAAFLERTGGDDLGVIWRVMAATGLRTGELCALRWPAVDLAAGRMTVPSGKAPRTIRLDVVTVATLARHRGGAGDGPVFTTGAGRPWNLLMLGRRFRRAVADAGLSPIPLHHLRLMHVRDLRVRGVEPAEIARRLGVSPAILDRGLG